MTNYSINKFNSKFEKNRVEGDAEGEIQEHGHKRSLKWFLKHIDSTGNDSSLLWKEIKAIVLKTLCSIQPILKHYYFSLKSNDFWSGCCFEVLGFDVMVSDRLKPYILEVNSSPSFGTDSALDEEIKAGLVRDTFRIVDFSTKRKIKIIKEERAKLSRRMLTGVREKVPKAERLATKCRWIREAETEMIKATGGLAGFEKVFGVDEYEAHFAKEQHSKRLHHSVSEAAIKLARNTKSSLFGKRTSLTVDRAEAKVLKRSASRQVPLLHQEDCLGVDNRHKVFEFIRYAELFEKKAHVSKSKRSKIDSLLMEDLKLMTQNDENCLLGKGKNTSRKVPLSKRLKPISSTDKLKARQSKSPKLLLKKFKSCATLGPKPHLRLTREKEAFQKLFKWQFYDRKMFLKTANLCPMIKLVFDLLKFLVDFELRVDVSSRVQLLKDFRWKRICFCRLCSYLTKIEKAHQFVFVKLRHFLKFYAFPKARPDSTRVVDPGASPEQLVKESVSAVCHKLPLLDSPLGKPNQPGSMIGSFSSWDPLIWQLFCRICVALSCTFTISNVRSTPILRLKNSLLLRLLLLRKKILLC